MVARDLTDRSRRRRWGRGSGATTTIAGIDEPRILLLCTANQCRSPMAEGILRQLLAAAGVAATVDSGGLLPGGSPATPHAVDVLAERGIDLGTHRSRSLAEVDLAGADLILTMERRHLQEAILLDPSVRPRIFTLPELVRRAEAAPVRPPGQPLAEWAASLSAGRANADLLGTGDGVEDPIGRSRARYVETATLLDGLLRRFLARAWPAASSAGAA